MFNHESATRQTALRSPTHGAPEVLVAADSRAILHGESLYFRNYIRAPRVPLEAIEQVKEVTKSALRSLARRIPVIRGVAAQLLSDLELEKPRPAVARRVLTAPSMRINNPITNAIIVLATATAACGGSSYFIQTPPVSLKEPYKVPGGEITAEGVVLGIPTECSAKDRRNPNNDEYLIICRGQKYRVVRDTVTDEWTVTLVVAEIDVP